MTFWRNSGPAMRWLVLASLCLNAVLITYVSVQWLDSSPRFPPGMAVPQRMMERVAGRLPKEDAEMLWSIYRGREAEIASLQTEYRRSLIKAMQVAGQTNLDKDALDAAVKQARDDRIKIGDAVIATFKEMLERISTKGRRQLVGGYFF